jgi:hypothetical protein
MQNKCIAMKTVAIEITLLVNHDDRYSAGLRIYSKTPF